MVPSGSELRAECAQCFGLCCVAPAFAKSSDFALNKPHGEPCPNLGDDFRCGIHTQLRERGFRGCQVFECFGAGQRISQHTFVGVSWREDPASAAPMFSAFAVARPLHELMAYLVEALSWPAAAPVHERLADTVQRVDELCGLPAEQLGAIDPDVYRGPASLVLREASLLAREEAVSPAAAARELGPDLFGANLRGQDLRGASLRGALLIAADLSGTDLRHADLIGADLRDANLRGANLTGALFLTNSQLTAAQGDATTRLSPSLTRPAHWG